MNSYQSHAPDVVERIGIVIWKIAVLVIGLRLILVLIPQQSLLDGLVTGSALLYGSALVLVTAGIVHVVVNSASAGKSGPTRPDAVAALRRLLQRIPTSHTQRRISSSQSMQHIMWRGSNWMLALGLESMLAAQIIQVSIASVGQNELNWWKMGIVTIIAVSRILI
jgi:hypothetical protein